MKQKTWFKIIIGCLVGSIFMSGCAYNGPGTTGTTSTYHSENEYDPARGLNPNSPSFWLDYQTIYGPR